MSALPAEKNEAKKLEYVLYTKWISMDEARALYLDPAKVQMKAAYFDDLQFPPIETPPTIEELAKRYLAAHEGLGC